MSQLEKLALASTLMLTAAMAQRVVPPPADPFAFVAALPAARAESSGLQVDVRGPDGVALGDAIVVFASSGYYSPERVTLAEQMFPGDEPRQAVALCSLGQRYQVTRRGRTTVPFASGRVLVVLGGQVTYYDHSTLGEAGERQVTLTVAPPRTFTTTVHTADGRPAAGVVLSAVTGGLSRVRARTDERGRATLTVIDDPTREPLAVIAEVATRTPLQTPVPREQDDVTLRLPPCSSVRARLVESLPPQTRTHWLVGGAAGDFPAMPRAVADTSQTFAYVEAGLEATVSCVLADFILRRTKFTAPAAGESIDVALDKPPACGGAMRLLLPDGTPAEHRFVWTKYVHGNGSHTVGTWSNAAGWLMLRTTDQAGPIELQIKVFASLDDMRLLGTATQHLQSNEELREDFDDVALTAPIVGAFGRLTTPDGRHAGGVPLRLRIASDGDEWAAESAADGTFEVMIPAGTTATGVHLADDTWFFSDEPGAELAVRSADEALEVRVAQAGTLRMDLAELPDGVGHAFNVSCESVDGSRAPFPLDWSTSAAALRVPQGRWHVVWRLGDDEVHRIEDVLAEPGIESHDPRLMFLDWRSWADVVSVRVENQKGEPTGNCIVSVEVGNRSTGSSPTDGVVRWLVPKGGGHITVAPYTGDEIDLGVVTGEQFVRLDAGPLLLLELAEAPTLPEHVQLVAGAGDCFAPFDGRLAKLCLRTTGAVTPKLFVQRGERREPIDQALAKVDVARGGRKVALPLDQQLQDSITAAVARLP